MLQLEGRYLMCYTHIVIDYLSYCERMFAVLFGKQQAKIDVKDRIDRIENEVYANLKPLGFRKHGRTLHRFVSGDISQVVSFQCGQSYRGETHLMWVNIGIRVPECMERRFETQEQKSYYSEAFCNMRSRLGVVKNKDANRVTTYDLRGNLDRIINDITGEIMLEVIPAFDVLSSREAILLHRREYPWFDTLNYHLIVLEESMIYGHLGELKKAKELFEEYYAEAEKTCRNPGHLAYLDQLAIELGLRINGRC